MHPMRGVATVDTTLTAINPAEAPVPAETPFSVKPPQPRNRLGNWYKNYIVSWIGLPWQRRLARAALYVPYIRRFESEYEKLNDDELRNLGLRLRGRGR